MTQESKIIELDNVVQASLREFTGWIRDNNWFGREKEAVSLYVLGFLQKQCRPGSVLFDPTQIAIEVAVPQVLCRKETAKAHVNKDLVIWDQPGRTCWPHVPKKGETLVPINKPLCIMEWKRAKSAKEANWDREWLTEFSNQARESLFCGYSVVYGACKGEEPLRCDRFCDGHHDENWLSIKCTS